MTISILDTGKELVSSSPFSEKIIEARNRSGYTIDQLAVTCGLTADEITALETGTDSDPLRLRRVAAALQMPLSGLV